MPNFRRAFVRGGTWFFTVNLLHRKDNALLIQEINLLRQVVKQVKQYASILCSCLGCIA
jgi:putative transposase